MSFNPLHYVLAGVCLLLVIVSGLYWYQGTQLTLTKTRFDAFVAETKAVGVVADAQGKLKNVKFESIKKDADHEINLARSAISSYADELRKRAQGSRGSLLPTPTASASNPERTDYDRSELVEAMGEYTAEVGAIRREITDIVTEGARAVSDLNELKKWELDVRTAESSIAQPLD
jgi:hypothetical protein